MIGQQFSLKKQVLRLPRTIKEAVGRRQGIRTRSLARVCQSTSNNSTLAWSGNRRTNPLPCALRSSANRDNRITGAGLGIAGVGHLGPPAPGRGTRFATLAEKLNSLACGASKRCRRSRNS